VLSRITGLALPTIVWVGLLLTVGTAQDTVVYSENFTSGATVDTLANPWTMWFGTGANFPIGTVPDGDKGILGPGPVDESRAVAAILLPASFNPSVNDYKLTYDIYMPPITSPPGNPGNQVGVGFATGKPATSSVDAVAAATIVSNVTPTTERFYDTANGIGGLDYTPLSPTTHNASFMGTTAHVEMDLLGSTGTMTSTVTGDGGATSTHSQSGLSFGSLTYLMMYTQGDGGHFSNVVLQTSSVPEPATVLLIGFAGAVYGLVLPRRSRISRGSA
jgi:hypothetical protein